MKKIVPRLLVISSQILMGALFFIFTISSKSEMSFTVDSKEIEKLSPFVYKEINREIKIEEMTDDNVIELIQEEKIIEEEVITNDVVKQSDNYFMDKEVISTYTGVLTGYGPDCYGCGNFNTNKVSTSSGYHIADIVDGVIQPAFTITYNDNEYGEVRIVAGDNTLPFNSIVRITIPNQNPIMAIVLDRGSTVGFENCRSNSGCLTNFDLLFATEGEALGKTYNVKFDILRIGS